MTEVRINTEISFARVKSRLDPRLDHRVKTNLRLKNGWKRINENVCDLAHIDPQPSNFLTLRIIIGANLCKSACLMKSLLHLFHRGVPDS